MCLALKAAPSSSDFAMCGTAASAAASLHWVSGSHEHDADELHGYHAVVLEHVAAGARCSSLQCFLRSPELLFQHRHFLLGLANER